MRFGDAGIHSCPVCGDALISVEESHGNHVYVCPTVHGRFVLPAAGRLRPETRSEWIRSLLGSRVTSNGSAEQS